MGDAPGISIVLIFEAPRKLMFRHWVRPEDLSAWFAPAGFTVTGCQVDARPGGRWQVEFTSAAGQVHREYGEFREVVAPERLAFTLTQQDGEGNTGPQTQVTVTFADQDSKTEMTFEQTGFTSTAARDGNAEGWKECFDKLEQRLPETESA